MTTNHTDLIRRLRNAASMQNGCAPSRTVCKEAADALEAMQAENFKLAAGQCANVTADEGGRPYCKEIESLRARLEAMRAALEQIITMAERGLGLDPSSMDNYLVWIQDKARAAIDAARGQE